jgi:hypothetical protein
MLGAVASAAGGLRAVGSPGLTAARQAAHVTAASSGATVSSTGGSDNTTSPARTSRVTWRVRPLRAWTRTSRGSSGPKATDMTLMERCLAPPGRASGLLCLQYGFGVGAAADVCAGNTRTPTDNTHTPTTASTQMACGVRARSLLLCITHKHNNARQPHAHKAVLDDRTLRQLRAIDHVASPFRQGRPAAPSPLLRASGSGAHSRGWNTAAADSRRRPSEPPPPVLMTALRPPARGGEGATQGMVRRRVAGAAREPHEPPRPANLG